MVVAPRGRCWRLGRAGRGLGQSLITVTGEVPGPQHRAGGGIETGTDRLGQPAAGQPLNGLGAQRLERVFEPIEHAVEHPRAALCSPAGGGRGFAQCVLRTREGDEHFMAHADRPDGAVEFVGRAPGQRRRVGDLVLRAPDVVLSAVVGHRAHQQRHAVDDVAMPDGQQQIAQPGGQALALLVGEHPDAGMGQASGRTPAAVAGVVDQRHAAAIFEHRPVGKAHALKHTG